MAHLLRLWRAMVATHADTWEAQIVPDCLLPEQFLEGSLGGSRLQPEKRLQLAVLEDAVMVFRRCAFAPGTRARRLLGEVDAWFGSDATDSPFAFQTVCDTLGLDASYVRRGLERWRSRPAAADARPFHFRRGGSGTRHQVVVNDSGLRRSA